MKFSLPICVYYDQPIEGNELRVPVTKDAAAFFDARVTLRPMGGLFSAVYDRDKVWPLLWHMRR